MWWRHREWRLPGTSPRCLLANKSSISMTLWRSLKHLKHVLSRFQNHNVCHEVEDFWFGNGQPSVQHSASDYCTPCLYFCVRLIRLYGQTANARNTCCFIFDHIRVVVSGADLNHGVFPTLLQWSLWIHAEVFHVVLNCVEPLSIIVESSCERLCCIKTVR